MARHKVEFRHYIILKEIMTSSVCSARVAAVIFAKFYSTSSAEVDLVRSDIMTEFWQTP